MINISKSLTKAESLSIIKKKIKNKIVPEFFFFKKNDYLKNPNYFLKKINKKFKKNIIIRSSAIDEDGKNLSNAGKYNSYIVKEKNLKKLYKTIFNLISKFKNLEDQILVQKLIVKPEMAGVAFTKDKNTNSHYYHINYDASKRSDLITSGKNNPSLKSLIIYKNSKKIPKKFSRLIVVLKVLEKIFKNQRLDVEFCIKKNKLYILQCRPLLGKKNKVNIDKLDSVIINLIKKFSKLNSKTIGLHGSNTILSNMSDWNPAEMIGFKPTKLASSIYSELITDDVWSLQRSNYGYKNVYPNKLMIDMAGSFYIDLRTDLNSFLPKHLNENISKKIVNHSINKLKKNKFLHDKIEFEIIDTCYTVNLEKKNYSFLNKKEKQAYIKSLKDLTNNILNKKNYFIYNEIEKLNLLEKKIKKINKHNLSHIQKIYYLIHDCKKYGTLPFAGIARCAFISKSILDSFVSSKILDREELKNFYLSLNTISKEINNDFIRSRRRKSFIKFLNNYGHLRPSTYSISIENYRDNFKYYFSNTNKNFKIKKERKFNFSYKKIKKINLVLKKKGLDINFNDFIVFAKKSIEQREKAKLIFSKSIDAVFDNLKKLAKEINLDFKDFEHLDIDLIMKSLNILEQDKLKKIIMENIRKNKKNYNFSKYIKTPDIILSENNFNFFYEDITKENYVTENEISSEIIFFNHKTNFKNFNNKIVVLENADPGFDFLFSYQIKGIITKYGGANSHMAIRCMELDLPSIIGIGEKKFEELKKHKKIYINCINKTYKLIQ